jgi:succinate-semialdehyde dehydrogenase/glutarate-semialdehyde dehydrogenase
MRPAVAEPKLPPVTSDRNHSPFRSVDPCTGRLLAEYPRQGATEVEALVARAARAQESFGRLSVAERTAPLLVAARLLRERAEAWAGRAADEMGKPLAQGRAEVEKCALVCEHYAAVAEKGLAARAVATEARSSYVLPRPLGLLLAVMPWNFPFWQVLRVVAPNLAAGNGVLVKHAAGVQGCALDLERLWLDAGLPAGLVANLAVDHGTLAPLIAHRAVAAVTLTGSQRAGREIAALAGAALKPTVLELGGSDAYLILADADLPAAAAECSRSRLINSGQSCIAAKRFVVVEQVAERFTALLAAELTAARVGPPRDSATTVGPLARVDLRDELHRQVQESVAGGARLRLGGEIPPGPGAFYPPTLLDRVRPGQPAADEELFGPVAAVLTARDEGEAIELANHSPFGLGAAVFTADRVRGERIAATELRAGSCFVNALVRSDPRLPFGGVGESGYGRELGVEGLLSFTNLKTVYVAGGS